MTTCGKCSHRVALIGQDGKINFGQFTCHRYPPVPMLVPTPQGINQMNCWPVVMTHDRCGEFSQDARFEESIPGDQPLSRIERPS